MKIKGFDNYLITPNGKVINVKTGKVLKAHDNGRGYLKVVLYKNGVRFRLFVHRLVASIRGDIPAGMCVDHIDRNKQNNYIDNLRIVNYLENNRNRGGRFEKKGKVVIS